MGLFQNLPIVSFFLLLILIISIPSSQATRLEILNNCSDTVWAAANPGGGKKLNHGETWNLTVTAYGNTTTGGRIWGRTNCAFGPDGRGKCESGDCGGLLECKIDGQSPNTVAVYLLNQTTDTDLFYVSVVEGFNIPMEFRPLSPKGAWSKASKCAEDVNGPCPMELRDPGGCNNPCTVFSNDQFCCFSGTSICEPTSYSTFFKDLCPEALTYPYDVSQSNARAPAGTDYKVVFCPSRSKSKTSSSDTNSTDKYNTANIDIQNKCPYVVWAAAVPGGGRRLNHGETWSVDVPAGRYGARIWARTNCKFDGAGRGRCQSGDCGGVLECQGYGQPPNTLAEFSLNQFNNLDFFDISLVDGFNVPMEFSPTSGGCRRIRCTGDINGQCPDALKAPGGCNNPCTVFKTDQYCCNSRNCGPTDFSRFFKDRCPDAYSYPMDDKTSSFTCPGGANYRVVFCP